MAKIKICGLTRPEDIEYANEFRPDYIGFVFHPQSRRYVTYEKAQKLKAALKPDIQAAGVFVDEKPETVSRLCRNGIIDIIQLHGNEDREYVTKLKTLTDKPVIKALRFGDFGSSDNELQNCRFYGADYLLLDSTAGSGKAFDWEHCQHCKNNFAKIFIAGGINASNAQRAIRVCSPYALDISSGVETGEFKDREKIREIISLIRGI